MAAVSSECRTAETLALLRRSETFGEDEPVECRETHISWVFLCGNLVFKLKKPVRYEFLDFSTVELRRQACQQELQLNRRLAANVYLAVLPIVRGPAGGLLLGHAGSVAENRAVDWVVKMQRLPDQAALDRQLQSRTLAPESIARLADYLADFYVSLPPVTMQTEAYRLNLRRHIEANRAELAASEHHLDRQRLQRLHGQQLRLLQLAPEVLDQRVGNGRIVDGHGDLRPEHIYFAPRPIVIDCVEFNRELRVVDVVDELSFLAMECDALGAHGIMQPVFDRYRVTSHDDWPASLTLFYQMYRACVRAKVCVLRGDQIQGREKLSATLAAERYLQLAESYADQLAPPMLVLIRGLPGTGKSTLAETLSEQLGWHRLQTDSVRRQLYGGDATREEFNSGRYHPERRQQVYTEMHRRAVQQLARGQSVVLDGTYCSRRLREEASQLAERYQATLVQLECRCTPEMAIRRIAERPPGLSEARGEFFLLQQQAQRRTRAKARQLWLIRAAD